MLKRLGGAIDAATTVDDADIRGLRFPGTFAFIGALGSWIRAVEVTSSSSTPHQVGVAWGYADNTGRAIAIFA